jgi:hypothetical protein
MVYVAVSGQPPVTITFISPIRVFNGSGTGAGGKGNVTFFVNTPSGLLSVFEGPAAPSGHGFLPTVCWN